MLIGRECIGNNLDDQFIVFHAKISNTGWFQLLEGKDLLLLFSFVIISTSSFGFELVGLTKQAI